MPDEVNSEPSTPNPDAPRDHFVATRWTVVLSAGRKSSPQSDRALGELCQIYWYPLYLANEWDKAHRQKRGGGVEHVSLDWQSAAERFHIDPPDPASPDRLFDREWALAMLERVITRLRDECIAEGKAPLFERAKGYLMVGRSAIPYVQAAQELNMDEGAVRVAVHRLRKRYRELLRDEIAQTLTDPAQLEEELRSLQAALSG